MIWKTRARRPGLALAVALACCAASTGPSAAQRPIASGLTAEVSGQSATLTFFNRPIVVLRARILGRGPAERVAAAERVLDELAAAHVTRPVEARSFDGGALINVGSRTVLALTSPDVDELAGETVDRVADQTVADLRRALDEAAEARALGVLVGELLVAVLALAVGVVILWGSARAHRVVATRLVRVAEQTVTRSRIADLEALRASRILDFERWLVTSITIAIDFVVIYATVTFVLRRFPYTRPWGESMRAFLVSTAEHLGLGIVNGLPGLFTAAVILVLARFLIRLLGFWFSAIERGRINARWIYPE